MHLWPRSLALFLVLIVAAGLAACDDDGGGGTDDDTAADTSVLPDTAPDGTDDGTDDADTAVDTTDTAIDTTDAPSGCESDEDCAQSASGPRCEVASGRCVECLAAADCDFDEPICSTLGTCSACQVDAQCEEVLPGSTCAAEFGLCQQCLGDDECAASPATPYCSVQRRCGECRTPFHCTDPQAPTCSDDPQSGAGLCVGHSLCTSDDAREDQSDDGPTGASDLTPAGGAGTLAISDAVLCASPPLQEADWFRVEVQDGDALTVTVDWDEPDGDIDVSIFDAEGLLLGESWYGEPEQVVLTHLPAGTIYIALVRFDESGPATVPYTITAELQPGACTAAADCALEYPNQILRGHCDTARGACLRIEGEGALAEGEACDSPGDCASGRCTYGQSRLIQVGFDANWYLGIYTAGADTRAVCTTACSTDAECTGGAVCTTVFASNNHCVAPCTDASQCPVDVLVPPPAGESWHHLACSGDGHCADP